MKIIPAVDIKNGKCVRLSQGKADQETIYSDHQKVFIQHWTCRALLRAAHAAEAMRM